MLLGLNLTTSKDERELEKVEVDVLLWAELTIFEKEEMMELVLPLETEVKKIELEEELEKGPRNELGDGFWEVLEIANLLL